VVVKYLLDANLPRALLHGLKRRQPNLDVLRVQQVGLRNASDSGILAFAAEEGRIVVSRDKATMREFAAQRIRARDPMPGLLVVRPRFLTRGAGLATVIEELLLIGEGSQPEEWHDVVQFIPFLLE
jgi:hypothetical protein